MSISYNYGLFCYYFLMFTLNILCLVGECFDGVWSAKIFLFKCDLNELYDTIYYDITTTYIHTYSAYNH